MKLYFSLSHKSFPEYAELPKGKAERHFFFAAREFYSSLEGIKAIGLVLLCGTIGLLLGVYFGPAAAAAGAGLGIYVGCILFNSRMKHSISAKLEGERARKSGAGDSATGPAIPESTMTPKTPVTERGPRGPQASVSKIGGRR